MCHPEVPKESILVKSDSALACFTVCLKTASAIGERQLLEVSNCDRDDQGFFENGAREVFTSSGIFELLLGRVYLIRPNLPSFSEFFSRGCFPYQP